MGAPDFPIIASMQDQLREYYSRKILAAKPEMVDSPEINFGNVYELYIRMVNEGTISEGIAELPSALDSITGIISVDTYKQPSDPDDTLSWTRAISAAKTFGFKVITCSAKNYFFSYSVDIGGLSGVIFKGSGRKQTIIKSAITELSSAFTSTGNCSDIAFIDMGWVGSAVDDVTGPRRSRTFGFGSIRRGIWLEGDLETGAKVIKNIVIKDCYFYGHANLPAFLTGIRGEARIESSEFDLNYDIGFTNNESEVFVNNRVTRSCDNGVSFSRQSQSVLCVGNTFENCAYWAIWLAGFSTQPGASNFVVVGNRGKSFGYGAITCDLGAQNGTISNNEFIDIRRGPTDEPNDNYGVGVFIGSYPADPANPTRYAENITVTGNTFIDVARGGVLVRGAKGILVEGNLITRPGSQFKADGTTVITTAMARENFGVAIDDAYINTVSDSMFRGNVIRDDRPTPYLNNPSYIGANANVSNVGNTAYGNRLQVGESAETIRGGLKTFQSGLRVGTSGIAGISLRLSATAGSSRSIQIETDSTARWLIAADGSSESGGDTGSNLVFTPMSDAGTSLGAAFTLIRATQGFRHENKPLGFFGTTPINKPVITGSRAGESAASASTRAAMVALGLAIDSTTA